MKQLTHSGQVVACFSLTVKMMPVKTQCVSEAELSPCRISLSALTELQFDQGTAPPGANHCSQASVRAAGAGCVGCWRGGLGAVGVR